MYPWRIFSAFQHFLSFFCVTLPIFSILLQEAGTRKPHWCTAEPEVNVRVTDTELPPHPDSSPPCSCVQTQLPFPARTWHRNLPGAACSFQSPRSHTGLLRTQPPFADHVRDVAFQVHNSPLACTKMTLFQWLHLPNKLHWSILPLPRSAVHQNCLVCAFYQRWVTVPSARPSRREAELASPFIERKGHRVYLFENAVFIDHVAETLV